MGTNFTKIILPTRPQPDTVLGIFLLKNFGKNKYPGIEKAEIEIRQELPQNENSDSLEKKGVLALDIGGGRFDHHQKNTTLSKLVAEDLGIAEDPCFQKLLTYGERDDKYGLGTISSDAIDKAFGLSGLIAVLNKGLPEKPEKVLEIVMPLLAAHCLEEKKKTVELPKEFDEKIKTGKAEVFEVKQDKKKLNVVILESDNLSMPGWLRSSDGVKADVVCQKGSSGYVNILTKPLKRVDLRWLAAYLRNEEAKLRERKLRYMTFDLMRPGKIQEIPEWYYDRATNSMLNGGTNPKGIEPTAIPFERLKEILKEALSQNRTGESPAAPQKSASTQYFLEIKPPAEAAAEIRQMLKNIPDGIKAHLPENYHITMIYFGCAEEKMPQLIGEIKNALLAFKPFEIIFRGDNFKSGKVPGYSTKAFYFEINESKEILKEMRKKLEAAIPNFQQEEFIPHLTVAAALPQIEEKVTNESKMDIEKEKKIKFLADKIRLTQVSKNTNGQIIYKTKGNFYL